MVPTPPQLCAAVRASSLLAGSKKLSLLNSEDLSSLFRYHRLTLSTLSTAALVYCLLYMVDVFGQLPETSREAAEFC